MHKLTKFCLVSLCSVIYTFAEAKTKPATQNFLFLGGNHDQLKKYEKQIDQTDISGVQLVYSWKLLEPTKDNYNFAAIEQNLKYLNAHHKKLFIQIQDRFFSADAKNIPAYLMSDPIYNGGITAQYDNPGENVPKTSGWVAAQWNPEVRLRFQKLIQALATKFDGKIYGINLPETAIDVKKQDKTGFNCKSYFNAEIENMMAAKSAFKHSYVVQYVNFFPCEWNNDHGYMSELFHYASAHNIGLGGPDVVPYKKAQMHNSYPFFHKYRHKLPIIAMAVQSPDYSYVNPKTKKTYSKADFRKFAEDYLGANIIFWDVEHNNMH